MIYFNDVDLTLKLAECGLLPRLPELLNVREEDLIIRLLPSLKHRVSRPNKKLKNPVFQAGIERFCNSHGIVEGASDVNREQELILGGMDAGEALLFAEAEATNGTVLTGDKRALLAYSRLSTVEQRACVKVICWEALLLRAIDVLGFDDVRRQCCEGIECDKLLKIVFSSGMATVEAHARDALNSYLGALKVHSADILLSPGGDTP